MAFRFTTWALILALLIAGQAWTHDENDEGTAPVFTQGEVIVTGGQTPAERVGSVEVIEAEQFRRMGAHNVAEALAGARSLRVTDGPNALSANGKQEKLGSLRGFDPRNVVVLIDGIPVYEPYFRVLDLRQIPVSDVARIKIIKGPTSVLYGPNALAGVINIITKKGEGPAKGHLEGAYGDVDNLRGEGSVLGGAKGFEYLFAPSFEKSDGFPLSEDFTETRNEDGGLRENSDYQDYALSGKFGYSKSFHGIALSANHYEFTGGVPFSMEATEPGTLWRKNWAKTSVSLHGETAPADYFNAKAKVFYTRFNNTITTYEDATMSSVADDGDAVSTYDNDLAGLVLMPTFFFDKAGSLGFSGIYKYDGVSIQDEARADWLDFEAETYSGAAEYQVAFWDVALVLGGAGHLFRRTKTPGDDLGQDNSAFDWMAGIAYAPLEQLEFHSAIAAKSAFPDLKALYSSTGNPDLKPEYAMNIDAGFRLAPWKPLSLESTWFYSSLTDLIGKQDQGNDFTYENIDEANITGVESKLSLRFFDGRLYADASHTWMKTEDKRDNRALKELDFRPRHQAFLDIGGRAPFGTGANLQYGYVGERKYEQPGNTPEEKSLPEYGLVNARISQFIDWDKGDTQLEFFIEGKNLGDIYYEDSPEKAQPGRQLFGGIAFDF